MVQPFGLQWGTDIAWHVCPKSFNPSERRAASAVFFGADGVTLGAAAGLTDKGVPVVPVVSATSKIARELPLSLRSLNALTFAQAGARRIASALLECCGLLPRQRRVFLSYRRDEARAAALQLFDELSARRYDVFLDTHAVAPGEAFQTTLWHRLCESDVLIMLDTATYFESRWTAAEFGRALAKGLSVLRVGWPGVAASSRTATATRIDLQPADLTSRGRNLARATIARIISQLELVRSESIAIRRLNLYSKLAHAIQSVGGSVIGVGIASGVYLALPDGRTLVAYPTVGVPTAESLHEARLSAATDDVAVVYDPIGISPTWLKHLEWLAEHIAVPRWVKVTDAAWDFADWEGPQ